MAPAAPLDTESIESGTLGALQCTPDGPIDPDDTLECTTTWDPASGNYDFPVTLTFTGPAGVSVSGESLATELTAEAAVFFMVAEADVPPPAAPPAAPGGELPRTGMAGDPAAMGRTAFALVLLGAMVALEANIRQRRSSPSGAGARDRVGSRRGARRVRWCRADVRSRCRSQGP